MQSLSNNNSTNSSISSQDFKTDRVLRTLSYRQAYIEAISNVSIEQLSIGMLSERRQLDGGENKSIMKGVSWSEKNDDLALSISKKQKKIANEDEKRLVETTVEYLIKNDAIPLDEAIIRPPFKYAAAYCLFNIFNQNNSYIVPKEKLLIDIDEDRRMSRSERRSLSLDNDYANGRASDLFYGIASASKKINLTPIKVQKTSNGDHTLQDFFPNQLSMSQISEKDKEHFIGFARLMAMILIIGCSDGNISNFFYDENGRIGKIDHADTFEQDGDNSHAVNFVIQNIFQDKIKDFSSLANTSEADILRMLDGEDSPRTFIFVEFLKCLQDVKNCPECIIDQVFNNNNYNIQNMPQETMDLLNENLRKMKTNFINRKQRILTNFETPLSMLQENRLVSSHSRTNNMIFDKAVQIIEEAQRRNVTLHQLKEEYTQRESSKLKDNPLKITL